jgi:hypothetical protein
MSSILNDIKHTLGIMPAVTDFDSDIMLFINGVFGTLTQLGVGPEEGFMIEDSEAEWDEFFDDPRLNSVKSYLFLSVKLQFDPPDRSFLVDAMERQKTEMEFRLNVVADYG